MFNEEIKEFYGKIEKLFKLFFFKCQKKKLNINGLIMNKQETKQNKMD